VAEEEEELGLIREKVRPAKAVKPPEKIMMRKMMVRDPKTRMRNKFCPRVFLTDRMAGFDFELVLK